MPSLVIGVDESGKGDFFGPLVVAGCAVADEDQASLSLQGVRDSKTLTDARIDLLAAEIARQYPHQLFVLMPSEYNDLYGQIKNLNKLLAAGHADVIAKLHEATGATSAISDKFGKPELIESELRRRKVAISLHQVVRGEQFPSVAAASILARSSFVRFMVELSEKWNLPLPKGAAAQVDAAGRAFVKKHGSAALREVAKLHFKNYQRATAML